jgi:integrase
VRLLRWADIDLEHQLVRWRSENDKIGYEHETWLTPSVGRGSPDRTTIAVDDQRVGVSGAIGPGKADLAALAPGLVAAGAGAGQAADRVGAWLHSLRRQFAMEMKSAPLKDLCALGGWKSPQTVLTCYQRADSASMQQALAARRRLEA